MHKRQGDQHRPMAAGGPAGLSGPRPITNPAQATSPTGQIHPPSGLSHKLLLQALCPPAQGFASIVTN